MKARKTSLSLCCAAVLVAAGVTATAAASASPLQRDGRLLAHSQAYNGLAATPPMGWNDWSYYQCNIDEKLILDQAEALVKSGLAAAGYNTVTIDDCWLAPERAADGDLQADPAKFPHGMAYIGQQLHAMGLKFGLYEDAGTTTCGGYPGSWGHFQQDATTFAGWGVDYVKLDGCNVPSVPGQSTEQTYRQAYTEMSKALVATGRPIVFLASAPAYFQGTSQWHDVISWSAAISNLWREGTDIPLGQQSGATKWAGIVRNYGYNVGLGQYAGPGHWNDPDFLLVGDSGLTATEMQTQMSLWAEMAAPLVSSTDLTALTPQALAILGNKAIIAVDQDPLGAQGHVVQSGSDYDILAKPLAGGDVSVVLFNQSDTAQTLITTATRAGLQQQPTYELTNLVTGQQSATTGTIGASVPPHGTVMLRVHPKAPHTVAPELVPYLTATLSAQGVPTGVRVAVGNYGTQAVRGATVSLSVPKGWSATPAHQDLSAIQTGGGSADAAFTVDPGTIPPGNNHFPITATISYPFQGTTVTTSGSLTVVTNVPYPTLAAAFNNVGVTSESAPAAGNFDGGGNSFSAEALAAAGASPGAAISHDGVSFTWPDVAAGSPDNVAAEGQTITLSGAGEIAILASAASLQGRVTATMHYSDGSTSTAEVGVPNWCCQDANSYGATPVIVTDHRDTPSGPANYGIDYDIFYNTIPTTQGKQLTSVTLPNDPWFHVFALQVKPLIAAPPTKGGYVSDMQWVTSTNGWGPVERDHSNGETALGDGNAITIGGTLYRKGMGTNSPSDITVNLGGHCTRFQATVGVDGEEGARGTVTFSVIADGTTLVTTPVLRGGQAGVPLDVDVSGAATLDLVVGEGGDGNGNDHGDWADARLTCS